MSEAIQKAAPLAKSKTLRDLVDTDDFKLAVARVLPKHITPERFVRVALTAMLKTPKLMECDRTSFFNALLSLSQMGLEPDGRRAHLIPFRNNKRNIVECTLVVDYKGFAELVMRSGLVSNIHGDVVCEGDVFEYDRGELKKHTIDFRKPRVDAYCVYSLVRFKDGTEKCEVMTVDEVESIRKRSKSANEGPWVTDWREMAKKTVFKRLAKWLPLTPEVKDAIDADEDLIEQKRFENALPIGSSFELAKPTFEPVEKSPGTGTDQPGNGADDADAVPAESGLSPQPSPGVAIGSEATAVAPTPVAEPPKRTIQDDISTIVLEVGGATYSTAHHVLTQLGWLTAKQQADYQKFDDFSDALCRRLMGAKESFVGKLKLAVEEGVA